MKKEVREKVLAKYNGHCAYCGKVIAYKDMQVDHLIPIRMAEEGKADWRDVENENNYMPSCRRCNHYKRGNSLEAFRAMISEIPRKLYRDNYIYKVGEDFGIISAKYNEPIQFYFEKVEADAGLYTERECHPTKPCTSYCYDWFHCCGHGKHPEKCHRFNKQKEGG